MTSNPELPEQMATAMRNSMHALANELGRLPNQDEINMAWAAVQRHFGIPEDQIEPSTQRRWN